MQQKRASQKSQIAAMALRLCRENLFEADDVPLPLEAEVTNLPIREQRRG